MADLTLPGLVDAHVHLREPGATHKEDAYTGTRAALAGGFVLVLDMPNNTPPITTPEALAAKRALFQAKAVADYGLFCTYQGGDPAPTVAMAGRCVGLKLYLDETFGHLTLTDAAALERLFDAWPAREVIAIHAESASMRVALALARRCGQRLHICHVSHPDDLLAIEEARQAGLPVTCEVTPHHLFLSTKDAARLRAYGQMKPPLVTPPEMALYWERLHLVDMIASDHAPHATWEKDGPNPPPGVPGLETTLPLLLWAVEQGRLTLERLVDLLHHAPLRAYRLPAPDAEVEVELGRPYRLAASGYVTRCGWSPFAGQWALGRVRRVTMRGATVYDHGALTAAPGSGREVRAEV
jgi:carbamoyl-phosphate synthase/aspartate carbamoyltransferase/dihydroorotase